MGDGPLLHAGSALNIIHVLAGAALLFIAFAVSGTAQANSVIASGVGFAALLVLTIASPRLFGLWDIPANLPDHVLHATLAATGTVLGWMARNQVRATGPTAWR